MNQSAKTPELTCSLSDQDYKRRRQFARVSLMPHIRRHEYTDDGINLIFLDSAEIVADLELFVSLEKQCCGFLDFEIIRQSDEVRLAIQGPSGAKDVIRKFAEGLSKQPISS